MEKKEKNGEERNLTRKNAVIVKVVNRVMNLESEGKKG